MQPPIVETYEFEAPPEAVFDAWTLGKHVLTWWRVADEFVTDEWEADLRVGGAWRAQFAGTDGGKFAARGVYQAVSRPTQLHFSWDPDWDEELPTMIAFDLQAVGSGTRLTATHSGFLSEQVRADNAGAMDAPMAMVREYLKLR